MKRLLPVLMVFGVCLFNAGCLTTPAFNEIPVSNNAHVNDWLSKMADHPSNLSVMEKLSLERELKTEDLFNLVLFGSAEDCCSGDAFQLRMKLSPKIADIKVHSSRYGDVSINVTNYSPTDGWITGRFLPQEVTGGDFEVDLSNLHFHMFVFGREYQGMFIDSEVGCWFGWSEGDMTRYLGCKKISNSSNYSKYGVSYKEELERNRNKSSNSKSAFYNFIKPRIRQYFTAMAQAKSQNPQIASAPTGDAPPSAQIATLKPQTPTNEQARLAAEARAEKRKREEVERQASELRKKKYRRQKEAQRKAEKQQRVAALLEERRKEAERAERARLVAEAEEKRKAEELARLKAERVERARLVAEAEEKRKAEELARLKAERAEKAKKQIIFQSKVDSKKPNDVAVIIANSNYTKQGKDIPNVDPAYNDAKNIKKYFMKSLGVREGNIIYLKDATGAQLMEVFGNKDNHKAQLFNWVKPNKSNVYVYYAGHGAPASKDGSAYLVPTDAKSQTIEFSGYPLTNLYRNLGKIKARSVTVILEACFSGFSQAGALLPRSSGITITPKEPTVPSNVKVISAGAADQMASWEKDESQSLFTKYFLLAMSGEGDKKPYGNGDGKVEDKELQNYLDDTMTYFARRYYGRDQRVQIVKVR